MDTIRRDDSVDDLRAKVEAATREQEADPSPRTWSLCGILVCAAVVAAGLVLYATVFHGCERGVRF